MSLTDLKRKKDKVEKRKLSLEEFIDDAEAYAKGKSVMRSSEPEHSGHHRNFKPATFTLSPESIEQLNLLAEKTGMAKSRLIREMIKRHYQEQKKPKTLKR